MATERIDIVVNETGATAAATQLKRVSAAGGDMASVVDNIRVRVTGLNGQLRIFGGLLGGLGVVVVAQQLQQAADAYTTLTNRIRLAATSQAEFANAEQRVFQIANQTRASFVETANLYARFNTATRSLRLTQDELFQVITTVNQAIAIGGATADGAKAGLLQFSQALASGVLRGEEFNSVMENIPGLAQALATGLRVPVGALRGMAEQGRITAQEIVRAMKNVAPEVARAFAGVSPTISQSLQVLQNAWIRFVGQVDQGRGVSAALAQTIIVLSQNLGLLFNSVVTLTGGWIAYRVAVVAATLASTFYAQATAGLAAGSAAAALGITTLTTTTGFFAVAARGATLAVATLTGLLRAMFAVLLANPFVTLATIIAAAAIAMFQFGNAIQINGISPLAAFNAALKLVSDGLSFLFTIIQPFIEQMARGAVVIASWVANLIGAENAATFFKGAMIALGLVLALTFLPTLTAVVGAFLLMGEALTVLTGGSLGDFTNKVIETGQRLKDDFIERMKQAQVELDRATTSTRAFTQGLEQVVGATNQTKVATHELGVELGSAAEIHKRWMDQINKSFNDAMSKLRELAAEEQRLAGFTRNAFGQMIQITDEWANRSGANFNRMADGARGYADATDNAASRSVAAAERVTKAWDAARGSGTPAGTLTQVFQTSESVTEAVAKITKALNDYNTATDAVAKTQAKSDLFSAFSFANFNTGNQGGFADVANTQRETGILDLVRQAGRILGVRGFATGGSFKVGGTGGTDSQLVQFMASPDERVTVQTPAQVRSQGNSSGQRPIVINMNVATPDANSFRRSETQITQALMFKLGRAAEKF